MCSNMREILIPKTYYTFQLQQAFKSRVVWVYEYCSHISHGTVVVWRYECTSKQMNLVQFCLLSHLPSMVSPSSWTMNDKTPSMSIAGWSGEWRQSKATHHRTRARSSLHLLPEVALAGMCPRPSWIPPCFRHTFSVNRRPKVFSIMSVQYSLT